MPKYDRVMEMGGKEVFSFRDWDGRPYAITEGSDPSSLALMLHFQGTIVEFSEEEVLELMQALERYVGTGSFRVKE